MTHFKPPLQLDISSCLVFISRVSQVHARAGDLSGPSHSSRFTSALLAAPHRRVPSLQNETAPSTFLLDTGSTITFIDPNVRRSLHLRTRRRQHRHRSHSPARQQFPCHRANCQHRPLIQGKVEFGTRDSQACHEMVRRFASARTNVLRNADWYCCCVRCSKRVVKRLTRIACRRRPGKASRHMLSARPMPRYRRPAGGGAPAAGKGVVPGTPITIASAAGELRAPQFDGASATPRRAQSDGGPPKTAGEPVRIRRQPNRVSFGVCTHRARSRRRIGVFERSTTLERCRVVWNRAGRPTLSDG